VPSPRAADASGDDVPLLAVGGAALGGAGLAVAAAAGAMAIDPHGGDRYDVAVASGGLAAAVAGGALLVVGLVSGP